MVIIPSRTLPIPQESGSKSRFIRSLAELMALQSSKLPLRFFIHSDMSSLLPLIPGGLNVSILKQNLCQPKYVTELDEPWDHATLFQKVKIEMNSER